MTGLMDLTPDEKQEILETLDLKSRIDRLLSHLAYRLEILKVSKDIDEQTKNRLDDRHREALLREQLKTIQSQLGEFDNTSSEAAGTFRENRKSEYAGRRTDTCAKRTEPAEKHAGNLQVNIPCCAIILNGSSNCPGQFRPVTGRI